MVLPRHVLSNKDYFAIEKMKNETNFLEAKLFTFLRFSFCSKAAAAPAGGTLFMLS